MNTAIAFLLGSLAMFSSVRAQTSTSATVPTATVIVPVPAHHAHLPPGAVAGIAIGVCLIVLASYFCCCHAACCANKGTPRRARDKGRVAGDVESQSQTRAGEETEADTSARGSIDKKGKDDQVEGDARSSSTQSDAPPRYEDS
ncbi:hypothetical protein DFH07DRAFT_145984 [Mycena maculata]|uniref:Uncharacterized protein n=1 Tax=Mycena maculata TaxID=230809 RepID=A0AAD7JZV6_9AGAR|nr:hypothetical protein DFH07DRAFT_145984 [Mycena maculata]